MCRSVSLTDPHEAVHRPCLSPADTLGAGGHTYGPAQKCGSALETLRDLALRPLLSPAF